jgi:hypothetical protein
VSDIPLHGVLSVLLLQGWTSTGPATRRRNPDNKALAHDPP